MVFGEDILSEWGILLGIVAFSAVTTIYALIYLQDDQHNGDSEHEKKLGKNSHRSQGTTGPR